MSDVAIFTWRPGADVHRASPTAGYYADPHIHPDGTHVAFWGGALGTPGLWQTDLGSGKCFRLTSMASGSWHPSYVPAGDRIVFVSDRFGNARSADMDEVAEAPGRLGPTAAVHAHVFVMETDGRGVRQITTGDHYDQHPAVSPDGARVAFVSNRGGHPGLWVAPFGPGAVPTELETPGAAPERVRWSRDGASLLFTYRAGDAVHLAAIAARGGPWSPVAVDDDADDLSVVDARPDPDGDEILVTLTAPGEPRRLAVLAAAGRGTHPLSPPGIAAATGGSRARTGAIAFASAPR